MQLQRQNDIQDKRKYTQTKLISNNLLDFFATIGGAVLMITEKKL